MQAKDYKAKSILDPCMTTACLLLFVHKLQAEFVLSSLFMLVFAVAPTHKADS